MIRIRQSLTINRPVAEVFRFMTEAGNIFKWSKATEEVRQLSPEPLVVGAKYLIVSKFLGFTIPLEVVITEFELNKLVASRSTSGGFLVDGRTEYTSDGQNTIVLSVSEIHPRGLWKLLLPVLPKMIANSSAQDFQRLRKALEESIPVDAANPPRVLSISEPVVTLEE